MDRQSEKPIGSKNGQDLYQTYIGQSRYTETNMNLLWCITMEKQSFLIKKKKKEEEDKKKSRALATNYEKLSIKPIVNPLIFLFILTRKGLKKNYRRSYRNQ